MRHVHSSNSLNRINRRFVGATRITGVAVVLLMLFGMNASIRAQGDASTENASAPNPAVLAAAALAAEEPSTDTAEDATAAGAGQPDSKIKILELLFAGGYLMWPIAAMSLLVVTFGIERLLGLRRRHVLPTELIHRVQGLLGANVLIQPNQLRALCDQHPSSAARVMRAAARKAGRPSAEIEQAVSDACDREASRLYANVRWLSLAAAISPLLGLLGTVWGMIQAFFATANLPDGANKADFLAEGIYVALVTTFAGLAVAIPAGVLAHMFEGRIQRLFRDIHELVEDLTPHIEAARPPHADATAAPLHHAAPPAPTPSTEPRSGAKPPPAPPAKRAASKRQVS